MPMQMTEAQAVNLVRNALIVAGQEMGAEGDHWPVIKSTVLSIMKDWEDLQVERNISAEVKQHYGEMISGLEKDLELCPPEARPEAERVIKKMREHYQARFSPMDMTMFVVCDADIPIHIKRAETIIKTLEGTDHVE